MRTIVVLGTGTDVGKTYVTTQIAQLLGSRTKALVRAFKPIETGVHASTTSDADRLARASSPPINSVHAYAFEPPISPHLAARRVGTEIQPEQIALWLRQRNPEPATIGVEAPWLLIESAGGVFSPISETKTNFDLAKALEPSCWILVAHDGLGVLHNVRSTLLAMRSQGRVPDLLVLNAPSTRDQSTGSNREEIARLGWARVIASTERDGGFTPKDESELLSALHRHFEPS